jgi:hypothetical protein
MLMSSCATHETKHLAGPSAASQKPRKAQPAIKPVRKSMTIFKKRYSIQDRLAEFGEAANERLRPFFQKAGVAYPPADVTFVAYKREKRLDLYARDLAGSWKFIRAYRIQAASGGLGPKLREGDKQVPEGIYDISYLNPNSSYHVSMRVAYPNDFDRLMALHEGRDRLGGDIMVHGKSLSAGCLAMGDKPAEELFSLAAWVGVEKVRLIVSPMDFYRSPNVKLPEGLPVWTDALYTWIKAELLRYQLLTGLVQAESLQSCPARHLGLREAINAGLAGVGPGKRSLVLSSGENLHRVADSR